MTTVPLVQGAYTARNVIANSQSCYNLYPEPNPKDAPFPVTHYCAPGTQLMIDLSSAGSPIRGLYGASDGSMYICAGQQIYKFLPGPPLASYLVGTFPTNSGLPVSMCDNQTDLVAVDGSPNGLTGPLSLGVGGGQLTAISDPAFYGSNHVDFIDTFLVFNWPGTSTFYTTTSNAVEPFNPLYFAEKIGWNDHLIAARVLHDNIWLLGNQTTEVWFNSGASDFPFQRMPNSIIQQGCSWPYSNVVTDNAIYWHSQDRWGHGMLMRGEGYTARRVSNFAVENEWRSYGNDVPFMHSYTIGGHEFVGMKFAAAYWAYDASTGMFHKRAVGADPSSLSPWPIWNSAYWGNVTYQTWQNLTLGGDQVTGQVFIIDNSIYTDNNQPITRLRAWPHIQSDGKRVTHTRFAAALDPTGIVPDGVNLAWSDDGGNTFGTPVPQVANPASASNGQYQWRRLGYARDRVYQLWWTGQGNTALNGSWVDTIPHAT